MKLALKSLLVVAAILLSFPEYRRHILRLRNTILAAPLSIYSFIELFPNRTFLSIRQIKKPPGSN